MVIDQQELAKVIDELYGDIDGFCSDSTVCILNTKGVDGEPMQILLLATNDRDEMISDTAGDRYECITVH